MKKIIFILALFVSFVANAQYTPPTGYTNINSRYDWLAGVFRALGLPAGGNASFTTGQAQRAGSVYYDSTGVDAGLKVWNGTAWVGVGEVTQSALDDTAAAIRGDFPTGSAANTNAGAFYRWLKPGTQEIKTFAPGYGILLDSISNADAITTILDSATVFPDIRATISSSGANTALSNLASVAINESLISDANNTDDLGSTSLAWKDIYSYTHKLKGATSGEITLQSEAVAGTNTITFPAVTSTVVLRGGTETITGAKTFSAVVAATSGINTQSTATSSNLSSPTGSTVSNTTLSTFQIGGATTTHYRVSVGGGTNPQMLANTSNASFIAASVPSLEGTSGTHPINARFAILPQSIDDAAGSTTDATTLYIGGSPTGTAVITNGATSFWVDNGIARFDGMFAAGTTSLTANQIWGANSGATAMEGKTLTNGQNIKITHGAGTATFAGATLTKTPTIENPTASENIWSWKVPVAITITDVHAVLVGSSTPSVTYNIKFDTDRSAAGTSVYTSNQTVTSTTTGTSASGVNDATIPAGSIVWIITSAQSGTVNQLGLTITYTED